MKRIAIIVTVLCVGWLIGCNKDDGGKEIPIVDSDFSLMDGSIIVTRHPNIKITSRNEFPISTATEAGISPSRKRMGMQTNALDENGAELKGNNYRFKLVAEMNTLTTADGVTTQATHVKITDDGYAFVSYNDRGDEHKGGVIVYKYTIQEGTLETVKVTVDAITEMKMSNAEVSAIDYYNNKLYLTGASTEPKLGYDKATDAGNPAFYMVMELNTDKTFKEVDPHIGKLTSFQGTSIRVSNNRIYVTTGDGTEGSKGGLYIFNVSDYSLIKFIDGKDNARSVDFDNSNVYLMQAEHARITKYNLDGSDNGDLIYDKNESNQHHAKSEILAWKDYLFVAENESGLRMLLKDGTVNASLDRPGEDEDAHVTNSVCMNSDQKKNSDGKLIQSDLLLLANGEKGIYWYDIMQDYEGKDHIISCYDNSILGKPGLSANFIASKGNIVFLADGLGGLKVLYIGFNEGDGPPDVGEACESAMNYLYGGWSGDGLLPETRSVFRPEADPIIKTLFSDVADIPNYIEVINDDTELYISFLFEGAGWNNALGYFVIPASANANTVAAEYAYYLNTIKPDLCTSDDVLKDKYIIFNNIRSADNGGPLEKKIYRIGGNSRTFKAGDKVVLFMVPNGWNAQNDRVEVSFSAGSWNQVFFMHKYFNLESEVKYLPYEGFPAWGDYAGVQYNTFYDMECMTMVMFFEDNHSSSDTDYNDVIISISDNINGEPITNFVLPKYAIDVPGNIFELFP